MTRQEEPSIVKLAESEKVFDVRYRVEVVPNHICPTVNLMDELAIVRDGYIIDTWHIRTRGKVR